MQLKFETSDGVTIAMDVAFAKAKRSPVVLCMTPYFKSSISFGSMPISELVAAGITCVIADIRGTGESGGTYLGPLAPREVLDGVELVEWLAAQDFCTGRVGMSGLSYPGALQLMIAAKRPRGLHCIAPAVAPIDFFRDWTHRGGIPSHTNWAARTFLARGKQPDRSMKPAFEFYYGRAQATPLDGALFQERSPAYSLKDIKVPTLLLGGLFDYFGRGTYRAFEDIDAPKRLVFGPWGHMCPTDPAELVQWFSYWLLDQGVNPTLKDNVHFWVVGGSRWIKHSGLPSTSRHRVSLSAGNMEMPIFGSISNFPQQTLPLPIPFEMDTATGSGMHLWGETIGVDVPIGQDVVVQGTPLLDLQIMVDECTDFDLHARLSLVGEGYAQQLTEGRLRLSHREVDLERTIEGEDGNIERLHLAHRHATPLSTASENPVKLEMLPASFSVPKGARLRLGLSALRSDGSQAGAVARIAQGSNLLLPLLTVG